MLMSVHIKRETLLPSTDARLVPEYFCFNPEQTTHSGKDVLYKIFERSLNLTGDSILMGASGWPQVGVL